MKEEIQKTITEIVQEIVEDNYVNAVVEYESDFEHDLELDSMDVLEIYSTLEKVFNTVIPEPEFRNMGSVKSCTEIVLKYKEEG